MRLSKLPWKWIGAGAVVFALIVAWRLLPLADWIGRLQDTVADLGFLGGVMFAAIYVAAVLLFVPGSVLTVAAGAIFGLARGTLVASVASTTAAAAAFLIARYLARRRVERMAGRHRKFAAIDRAIGKKGWKAVALLRLSPLVPFSLSNYLYGLTAVDFWPYLFTSWAAMLPATVLYVSLGAAGHAASGGGDGMSTGEWALLAVGIAATIVLTLLLSRAARKELARGHMERTT